MAQAHSWASWRNWRADLISLMPNEPVEALIIPPRPTTGSADCGSVTWIGLDNTISGRSLHCWLTWLPMEQGAGADRFRLRGELPFTIIVGVLSRWSGGLLDRTGENAVEGRKS